MLKSFIVNGQIIDGELLDTVNKNGLTRGIINNRVHSQHWSVEDACRLPIGKRPKKINKLTKGLKVYHMDIEKCHEKYGKPGELLHPYPEEQDDIVEKILNKK